MPRGALPTADRKPAMMYAFMNALSYALCLFADQLSVIPSNSRELKLGVPRLTPLYSGGSRVGLSAASPRPEDRPVGFPLLSLTRNAVIRSTYELVIRFLDVEYYTKHSNWSLWIALQLLCTSGSDLSSIGRSHFQNSRGPFLIFYSWACIVRKST